MRVVPMAIFALELSVHSVNVELGALVLADLPPGIYGVLLPVEVTATTSRTVSCDVPTAIGIWHDVM
jgi:hypothetical protein